MNPFSRKHIETLRDSSRPSLLKNVRTPHAALTSQSAAPLRAHSRRFWRASVSSSHCRSRCRSVRRGRPARRFRSRRRRATTSPSSTSCARLSHALARPRDQAGPPVGCAAVSASLPWSPQPVPLGPRRLAVLAVLSGARRAPLRAEVLTGHCISAQQRAPLRADTTSSSRLATTRHAARLWCAALPVPCAPHCLCRGDGPML